MLNILDGPPSIPQEMPVPGTVKGVGSYLQVVSALQALQHVQKALPVPGMSFYGGISSTHSEAPLSMHGKVLPQQSHWCRKDAH